MNDTQETIADIIAEMRKISAEKYRLSSENGGAYGNPRVYHFDFAQFARVISDRLEAAHKRERVLAVSIMRSKLYGIAGGLRAITARSDARQRGIHYTEVQNIAAQLENIADNGGEA